MGPIALTVATLCYVVAAIDLGRRRDAPMALVFAAYALANCGLIWASYRQPILAAIRQLL